MTTLAIVVLLAFAGFVIDIGRVYVAQRQLQQAVDAASLAASVDLSTSTFNAFQSAKTYSAATGQSNQHSDMTARALVVNPAAGQSGISFLCLGHTAQDGSGAPCITDSNVNAVACLPGAPPVPPSLVNGCNAVRVTETGQVDTPLLAIMGLNFAHFNTVSASSTASLQGGVPHPLDVAIVIDTSGSMRDYCNATISGIANSPGGSFPTPNKLDCVKQGIASLLKAMLPCAPDLPLGCGAPNAKGNVLHPDDEVSLFVFPGLTNSSDSPKELNCVDDGTHTTPSQLPVSYGPTANYQVVGFQSDFRANDGTTLLTNSSRLVQSIVWSGPSCLNPPPNPAPNGTAPANDIYGVESTNNGLGTSFADAINAAQAALAQNYTLNPGRHAQPVIIFLSDGEANSGSANNTPCLDAFNAAKAAKNTVLAGNPQGTWFYSIAYDSSQNCTDKNGTTYHNVAGLQLMKDMSTNTTNYFFNQPSAGSLTTAFQAAGATLTGSRLVPDSSS